MQVRKAKLLVLLAALLAFTCADRTILGLATQAIGNDLSLSDGELGFISGIAFAFFYSILGLPIAYLADRGSRVKIIVISTALFGFAVALCGLAQTFVQLLLLRVATGIGEAGCGPAGMSLISDHFARGTRPRATSAYMQGATVGLLVSYLAGGWLIQLYGWRITFVAVGIPALALAGITSLVLTESRPTLLANDPHVTSPSMIGACRILWKIRSFRHMLLGWSVMMFFVSGASQWTPTFFVRSFGMKIGELGTWFGITLGLTNALGVFIGGEWASRGTGRSEMRQLKAIAVMIAVSQTVGTCCYVRALAPTYAAAFGWITISGVASQTICGPVVAALQSVVPERLRAISAAVVGLFVSLVGLGLGPWAVGALSGAVRPWIGAESLRYALLFTWPFVLWSAWHFWAASGSVMRDAEVAERDVVWRLGTTATT